MQKRNLKKFILMIVEGKSDKKYLYPVDKIVKEKNCFIEFKITNGDILSDKDTTPKNVTIKIGLAVQSFLDYSKLLFENIFQVVHIVDLDGVFIKDDNVITDSSLNDGETIYSRNDIKNINRDNIIRRNKKKRDCLNLLYKLNEIPYGYENKLPYKIYYFSTNIDDYFVGDQNSDLDKKINNSIRIGDLYLDYPELFREKIETENCVNGEYIETWEYVKNDNNSLSRCTNFNKFFEDIVDYIIDSNAK